MRATRNPISHARLGGAYSVTEERARQLVAQFGFDVVADPARLFAELLDRGNDSPLRRRLGDPARRLEISNKISAES